MKMLDVLMQWGWVESTVSYTNRPALNELVSPPQMWRVTFWSPSSHICLVLMETGRCAQASHWNKTLCLSGVSFADPSKDRGHGWRGWVPHKTPRSQHLDQPPNTYGSKALLCCLSFPLPSDSWDSSSSSLGISGMWGSQTTLRVSSLLSLWLL